MTVFLISSPAYQPPHFSVLFQCFSSILVTPPPHVLTVLVEDKSGVLNRIASLFRRRRYNIESLTVGHSETPGFSRMTIVVDGRTDVTQVTKQMYKIIEVIKVTQLTNATAVVRDLALVTFHVNGNAPTLTRFLEESGARIVTTGEMTLTAEFLGTPEAVSAFLKTARTHEPIQISRSGATAVATTA